MFGTECQSVRLPTLVPPQTYSTWPVMNPASALVKNVTARATSAASPSRFTGTEAASVRSFSLPAASVSG